MSGFAHDVAGGNGDLIIRSVQSPNFVPGSAGWQIAKDGSAEFNDLTIRGTFKGTDFIINTAGLWFYYPSEAAGNLRLALTGQATTGPYGESVPSGMTIYGTTDAMNPGLSLPLQAANQSGDAFINSYITNQGAANEYYNTQHIGPQNAKSGGRTFVYQSSAATDGSSPAQGALGYFDASGNQNDLFVWQEDNNLYLNAVPYFNNNVVMVSGNVPRIFYGYLSGNATITTNSTDISQFDQGLLPAGKHFLVDFNFMFQSASATNVLTVAPTVPANGWLQTTAYRPGSGSTTFANVLSAGSVGSNPLACTVASATSWYSVLGSGIFKQDAAGGWIEWLFYTSAANVTLKAGSYVRYQQLD